MKIRSIRFVLLNKITLEVLLPLLTRSAEESKIECWTPVSYFGFAKTLWSMVQALTMHLAPVAMIL